MSSAWVESEDNIVTDVEKAFEDNFVANQNGDFKKLDDSEDYLKLLGKFRPKFPLRHYN